jgi:hypothetical protein
MARSYHYPPRNADQLSDSEILAEAHELVDAFLEFVRTEQIRNDIFDVRALPASKSSIENAFRLVIATEPRKEMRQRLATAGLAVARFQKNVGMRMSITPAPQSHDRSTSDGSDDAFNRFDAALLNMARDTARLQAVFADAGGIAERRFAPMTMSPPFREDGTYTWYGHH